MVEMMVLLVVMRTLQSFLSGVNVVVKPKDLLSK